jgi:hypothetical protein
MDVSKIETIQQKALRKVSHSGNKLGSIGRPISRPMFEVFFFGRGGGRILRRCQVDYIAPNCGMTDE